MLRSIRHKFKRVIVGLTLAMLLLISASGVVSAGPDPPQMPTFESPIPPPDNGNDLPPLLEDMEIGGISVLVLIIMLVQVAKSWFGLSGMGLRYLSFGLGVLFGVLYQATVGFPTTVSGWIVFAVRLLYGILASGLVDFARDTVGRTGRAMAEVLAKILAKQSK
jgi:hypothetical protein